MSIQATEGAAERTWLKHVSEVVGDYDQFGVRPWRDIEDIEFLPGIRIGDDVYSVPEKWLPPGGRRRKSFRNLAISGANDEIIAASTTVGQSLRRSLVALGFPRLTENGIRTYKPSSWLNHARVIRRMARISIAIAPSVDGSLWSHLGGADWQQLKLAMCRGDTTHSKVDLIIRQLRGLGLRGVLSDFPAIDPDTLDDSELDVLEAKLRNREVSVPRAPTAKRTYSPLSDEFVSIFISRSMWFQEVLGRQIIECWALLLKAKDRAQALGRASAHPTTTRERQDVIAAFDWRDINGRPLRELPWPVTIREGGRTYTSREWPPRDAAAITMLVGMLQAMNFCTIAFCTGARTSEILAATTRSLENENGRLVSRTFKLISELDGQLRDWPLPPAAIRALELQLELSAVIRPSTDNHIWVLLFDGSLPAGSGLFDINQPIARAVLILNLRGVLGDIRPHAHRWRHTVGRMVALSISTAPKVLQDLFGHRDLEMTLRYMMSDPEVAENAIIVAEEAAMLVAGATILEIEKGSVGGPAARGLEAGLTTLKIARGDDQFSAEDIRELANILTFSGRYWQIVRPGILCTKSLGEYGPCTRGRGAPDPGSCRTDCDHRLETDRARRDCEELLGTLLVELAEAAAQGLEMLVANLEGQILSNLKRWEDIRERVIAQNTTAARIWASAEKP